MAIKRKFSIRVGTVYCNGGCRARKKMKYQTPSCDEKQELCEDGPLECVCGFLGCGTCANACQRHGIGNKQGVITEVR